MEKVWEWEEVGVAFEIPAVLRQWESGREEG